MADDFASGTRAAAAGGNTTVMPFAVQPRGRALRGGVDDYTGQGRGPVPRRLGIHMIVSDPSEACWARSCRR